MLVVLVGGACGRLGFGPAGTDTDADPDADVRAGLVARYLAGGNGLVDEAGDGPPGICSPCPVAVETPIGRAYDFAGVNGVQLVDDGRFAGTGGFTVALWVQPTADPGVVTFVGKRFGGGILNSWMVTARPEIEFETTDGSDVDGYRLAQGPAPDQWTHVAVTWDRATKRVFSDGVEIGSALEPSIAFDGRPIWIGADQDLNDAPKQLFDGLLSDLRVYDRALSVAEIAQLAAP